MYEILNTELQNMIISYLIDNNSVFVFCVTKSVLTALESLVDWCFLECLDKNKYCIKLVLPVLAKWSNY